ncbi:ABC transporter permease [Bullifex sp.]|uniref:ABC transporter permease n=1 Tax=Bullifex sp. TaxID=2815808 RepID=UPI002A81BC22|nr:ABC transporter permease [Bullifex sp.]MDY4068180.1 ABC transporter permease [Bullifex sp.]
MVNNNILKKQLAKPGMRQVVTVFIGLIVLCIAFGIINPLFFSSRNLSNLLRQIAPIVLIGIGQSFVLITGNIDLSIGSIVGMSTMMSATMMTKGMNPWMATLITLIASLAVGVVNGYLVAGFKLPPFIATLGTMTICRGIAQIANGNYNTGAINTIEKTAAAVDKFRDVFYYGKTLGLYNGVWLAIIVFLIFNFVLTKTRSGRYLYALGSNPEAARLSGVSVLKTTTIAYLVSAFCSCLVGIIQCCSAGMGAMDAGNSYEMYGVAASVIGGVSTLGGTGRLIGTVVGAAIWSVLQNGLQFAQAPVAIRNIIIGIIVIVAVLLDIIIRRGPATKKKTNKSKN